MTAGQEELPAGWKWVKLEDVSDILSGFAWRSSAFNNDKIGLPIIRIQNLGNVNGDFAYWAEDYDRRYLVSQGDLLLSLSGSFKSELWHGPPALLNQRIVKIQPKPVCSLAWLMHCITHQLDDIASLGKQFTISNVSLVDLKALPIPLPPLEEQQRIAGILNKADELNHLREEADKKTEELIPAIFHEMVGSRIKKGEELPSGWKWVKLGDVCGRISVGYVGQTRQHYVENGIPLVRTQNVKPGYLDVASSSHVTKRFHDSVKKSHLLGGDLVITRTGYSGICAVVPFGIGELNCSDVLFASPIRGKLDADYAQYFINSSGQQKLISTLNVGAAQRHYNTKTLQQLLIALPSLEEQKRISARLNQAEEIKKTNAESDTKIEELKSSLLQRAFRGEL